METKDVNLSTSDKVVFDGRIWIDKNGVKHRYIDPMNDEGFKILFGTEGNEELLKELLNRIIPGADIVDLRYNNVEHHGMIKEDGRAIFDVYCEDSEGVRFLVEMQNWSQRYFNKRAVYYSTFAIQDQAAKERKHQVKTLGKDRWDYNYAPVYVICFMSFEMKRTFGAQKKEKADEYLSFFRYKDIETEEELGDGTTLAFVEMPKFRKSLKECSSEREHWMYMMKNMSTQLEMPSEVSDPLMQEIYRKAEIAALPEHVRMAYITHIMSRNDELNSRAEQLEDALAEGYAKGLALGHEEGLEQGKEQGIQQGIQQGIETGVKKGVEQAQIEIAAKMLGKNMPIDQIAELTGLSIDRVSSLK